MNIFFDDDATPIVPPALTEEEIQSMRYALECAGFVVVVYNLAEMREGLDLPELTIDEMRTVVHTVLEAHGEAVEDLYIDVAFDIYNLEKVRETADPVEVEEDGEDYY